jgi:hypothetical protein
MPMSGRHILALAGVAGMLTACQQTVSEHRRLPDAALPLAGIGDVVVETSAPAVNATVAANLKAALEQASRGCGYGPVKYALTVRLETFKAASDSIQLAGSVQLADPQTRVVLGEYRVDVVRDGGRAAMAGAQETLPKAFADRVCNDVLRRKPTTIVTIPQPGGNISGEKSYRP